MDMKLKIKDIKGNTLKIGDTVRILKFTDDSGEASDIYGVEPQLSAWVEILYIEPFEGKIFYDEDKMMMVIKNKSTSLPLSKSIRYEIYISLFDKLEDVYLKETKLEYNLPDEEYESIIDYIVKL